MGASRISWRLTAAVCGGLLAPGVATAATAPGAAKGIVVRPLSIVKLRDLDFGTLIAGASAGTAVLDPDTDARTTTGGTLAAGGAARAAQFYTYGGPLQYIYVTRGALPTLTRAGGGSMAVTQLTLNGPVLRYLDSAGLLDLRVGGTLAVGANQAEGSYTGTFQITVTYF